MSFFLITGTPGISKARIAQKLEIFFKEKDISVGIGNIEKELEALFPEDAPYRTSEKKSLVALIGQEPKDVILEKWKEAYVKAIEASQNGSPDISIVIARLMYYKSETFEYFSSIDYHTILKNKPDHILTLIDDIYDIYFRLSKKNEVFDIEKKVDLFTHRSIKELPFLYKNALGLTIDSLIRILFWREKEIECGASLGKLLGCGHDVLAVKHPISTGARLLLGSSSEKYNLGKNYSVYISHPIARPRRHFNKRGVWPDFVNELEEFTKNISDVEGDNIKVISIMPTAIDELRIFNDGKYLHPHLSRRWPIIKYENLLYCCPAFPDKNEFDLIGYEKLIFDQIFNPPIDKFHRKIGIPLSDPEVSGILRTLQMAVRLQMAGRDHLLVRQSPGLLLYRPIYEKYGFSSGVVNEIRTFNQVRMNEIQGRYPSRRIAFIYDEKDTTGFFDYEINSSSIKRAVSDIHTAAKDKTKKLGKTIMPNHPTDKMVSETLKEMCPNESVEKRLYEEMFQEKGGTIGHEDRPSWDSMKDSLKKSSSISRAIQLSLEIESNDLQYKYEDFELNLPQLEESKSVDTYVEVSRNINKSEKLTRVARNVVSIFAKD